MSADPQSPRDANTRDRLQQIARMIDEELPHGWGFALLCFPFEGELGRLNYISNAKRETALPMIREWLNGAEKEWGKHA